MLSREILSLSVVIALLPALAGAGDAKKEAEALQGTWKITDVLPKASKVIFANMTVEIKGDKVLWLRGEKVNKEDTFKVDPSKTPRAMDLKRVKGNPVGETSQSIYKLEGDTLTICTPILPGMFERPTEFKGGGNVKNWVLTLKRAK